jgi:Cof subfamily protein (haloacid dehalogenase superfamily)
LIKLIALDLDGTLNNDEKKITPQTKAALLRVQEAGIRVVLASGRPAPGLLREATELDLEQHHGLLLSYNGGKVIDLTSQEILYENSISNKMAKKLLQHLEPYPVTPIVDDGQYFYTDDEDSFYIQQEKSWNNMESIAVANVCDAVDFNPVKILIAAPPEDLQPLISAIREPFCEELSFIASAPFYLEATAKGINKAFSLDKICQKLQIKQDEVMAFGDAANDLSMIDFAGVGVAMGNACSQLKERADEITLSNNEDGIAHMLYKYFPSLFEQKELI